MASFRGDLPVESRFGSTHWSVVSAAGGAESEPSRAALEELCRRYWYPLYAYLRRQGYRVHEAEDLTQAFLTRLLEANLVAAADPARGRFRSFLLAALKNFLADARDKARAQKRGGGASIFSLDFSDGESRYQREPSHAVTAEILFEREWATTVLDHVMSQLRDEYVQTGKGRQFATLNRFLGSETAATSYRQAAANLQMSEGAARVAAHRLRRRFAVLFRAELARALADPADVEDEARRLLAALDAK